MAVAHLAAALVAQLAQPPADPALGGLAALNQPGQDRCGGMHVGLVPAVAHLDLRGGDVEAAAVRVLHVVGLDHVRTSLPTRDSLGDPRRGYAPRAISVPWL